MNKFNAGAGQLWHWCKAPLPPYAFDAEWQWKVMLFIGQNRYNLCCCCQRRFPETNLFRKLRRNDNLYNKQPDGVEI